MLSEPVLDTGCGCWRSSITTDSNFPNFFLDLLVVVSSSYVDVVTASKSKEPDVGVCFRVFLGFILFVCLFIFFCIYLACGMPCVVAPSIKGMEFLQRSVTQVTVQGGEAWPCSLSGRDALEEAVPIPPILPAAVLLSSSHYYMELQRAAPWLSCTLLPLPRNFLPLCLGLQYRVR